MKRSFTFLGTGTSQGIPVIGCDCEVCHAKDPKDTRLRSAGLVTIGNKNIVIDTGPDFRQQMLTQKVKSIEAILFTHEHNDHIIGLDDIRPFYFRQKKDVPVYGLERVLSEVKNRFDYFFKEKPYPGVPRILLNPIKKEDSLSIAGQSIQPIEVRHGQLPILGYRFDNLVYITDAKTISDDQLKKIINCDILILNALHHFKHHSHLNLEEAIEFVNAVNPKKAWFTHMSHMMGKHSNISKSLPSHIQFAYDGLIIDF